MTHRKPRGAALVVTMITMGILTVIVAGAIAITGKNREASVSRRRALQIQSCAESGKARLVMAVVRPGGNGAKTEILNNAGQVPNGSGTGESLQIATGHIGSDATDGAIEELAPEKTPLSAADQPQYGIETGTGGQSPVKTYRAVVRCREEPPAVRPANYSPVEAEVEFLFQVAGI